jgi:site-specific recombinase XerD
MLYFAQAKADAKFGHKCCLIKILTHPNNSRLQMYPSTCSSRSLTYLVKIAHVEAAEAAKELKRAFDRARRHANLSGVTPHSLRNTWASRMEMSGASQKTLMDLGGWKDPKMVARYSHASKQHRTEAVEKIASYSPSIFTTPKMAEPGTPCAPVAQVDRATVS